VGYSCIVRTQAAFHSALVMCVSRSQNPMQSARDLPPPPGALGADSLGLAETPGDSAMFGCTTPPVENWVGSCGDSGGIGGSSADGAAIADGGKTPGGGGVGIVPIPEFSSAPVLPAEDELPAGLCMDWDLPPMAGGVVVTGKGERIAPPPPGSPEGGCTADRPIRGEGVVAICDIDVIGREIALP
jgi:hypothetical protein